MSKMCYFSNKFSKIFRNITSIWWLEVAWFG